MVFVQKDMDEKDVELIRTGFQKLAHHYKGAIQFGWVVFDYNEKLRLAYEIESPKHNPRSFFIDMEGVAYSYFKNKGIPSLVETTEWIEDRYYK